MSIAKMFLGEFVHEATNTRNTLAVVPEKSLDYKPHEKSFHLGRLAGHVAEIPHWTEGMIADDVLDLAAGFEPLDPSSVEELLAAWDKNVATFNQALEGASDEHLSATWKLCHGDSVLFEAPRMVAIRGFVLNHMYHHRGQLQVYLRLLDIPLPSIYGPTADAEGFGG